MGSAWWNPPRIYLRIGRLQDCRKDASLRSQKKEITIDCTEVADRPLLRLSGSLTPLNLVLASYYRTDRTSLPLLLSWRAKRERSAGIPGLSRTLGRHNVVRRRQAPSGRKYFTALPNGVEHASYGMNPRHAGHCPRDMAIHVVGPRWGPAQRMALDPGCAAFATTLGFVVKPFHGDKHRCAGFAATPLPSRAIVLQRHNRTHTMPKTVLVVLTS